MIFKALAAVLLMLGNVFETGDEDMEILTQHLL